MKVSQAITSATTKQVIIAALIIALLIVAWQNRYIIQQKIEQ